MRSLVGPTLRVALLSSALVPGFAGTLPAAPVNCGPGEVWDPSAAECKLVVIVPEDPPDPGDPSIDPVDGGGAVPPADPTCSESLHGTEVPCETAGGWRWVQGWNAYARLADPQPPTSDAAWEGNTEGAIYQVGTWLGDPTIDPGIIGLRWSMNPPWVDVPDPRVLAHQAIASMNLRAVDIGIVPEDVPGSVGLVGLPTWMWAESPGENTIGPITRSASAGGFTVTATGEVTGVVWDMGDGAVVTCTGPGTAYEDSYLDSDSPTCGHRYEQDGQYAVTATSQWLITWSGMGQTGTIPLEVADTTSITVGEVQVLNQAP